MSLNELFNSVIGGRVSFERVHILMLIVCLARFVYRIDPESITVLSNRNAERLGEMLVGMHVLDRVQAQCRLEEDWIGQEPITWVLYRDHRLLSRAAGNWSFVLA